MKIKPKEKEETSKHGIIIEDEETSQATVEAVAPNVTTVKKGDTILFPDYAVEQVGKHHFIEEEDIYATLS